MTVPPISNMYHRRYSTESNGATPQSPTPTTMTVESVHLGDEMDSSERGNFIRPPPITTTLRGNSSPSIQHPSQNTTPYRNRSGSAFLNPPKSTGSTGSNTSLRGARRSSSVKTPNHSSPNPSVSPGSGRAIDSRVTQFPTTDAKIRPRSNSMFSATASSYSTTVVTQFSSSATPTNPPSLKQRTQSTGDAKAQLTTPPPAATSQNHRSLTTITQKSKHSNISVSWSCCCCFCYCCDRICCKRVKRDGKKRRRFRCKSLIKSICCCCCNPSIFCVLMLMFLAFLAVLFLMSGSWVLNFSLTVSSLNSKLMSERSRSIQEYIEVDIKSPTIYASSLYLSFEKSCWNNSSDVDPSLSSTSCPTSYTETVRTLYAYMISSMLHIIGPTLSDSLDSHLGIYIHPYEGHAVGFATPNLISEKLVFFYTWPGTSDPNRLITRLVPDNVPDEPFEFEDSDLYLNIRNMTLSWPVVDDIRFIDPLTRHRAGNLTNYGRYPQGIFTTDRFHAWSNTSVLCLAGQCVHMTSFFHLDPKTGVVVEVFRSTLKTSVFLKSLTSRGGGHSFIFETKTGNMIASSEYEDYPTFDGTTVYHVSTYTHSDIRRAGEQILQKSLSTEFQSFSLGSSFIVNYARYVDPNGIDWIIVAMHSVSSMIAAPAASATVIVGITIILSVVALCCGCCINCCIRRPLKELRKNMLFVRDMKLEQIRTNRLLVFSEIKDIHQTFHHILLPKLKQYKSFIPDHLIGDSDSESTVQSESCSVISDATQREEAWCNGSGMMDETSSAQDRHFLIRPTTTMSTLSHMDPTMTPHNHPPGTAGGDHLSVTPHRSKRRNRFDLGLHYGHICVLVVWFHNVQHVIRSSQLSDFTEQFSLFFGEINRIIRLHKGFLDNFSETVVVVTFRRARQACDCAYQIQSRLDDLNKDAIPLKFSIGVATGKEYFGTIGEENLKKRHSFGVVSKIAKLLADDVGATWNVKLLVDENTRNEVCEHYRCRPLTVVTTKDGRQATGYQILQRQTLYDGEWLYKLRLNEHKEQDEIFCRAFSEYMRQNHTSALALFEKYHESNPEDLIVQSFINQCRTKAPPMTYAYLQVTVDNVKNPSTSQVDDVEMIDDKTPTEHGMSDSPATDRESGLPEVLSMESLASQRWTSSKTTPTNAV